jgi:hypothetical protein
MQGKNWRLINVGIVLVALAAAFFFYMLSIASKSNDPKALMETVGQVSGVVGGIGIVMSVVGLIGKKP